ncbi:sensor histidine kinase [Aeromicrobium piscarium]|uniref:sensor histidine kinase n=1 Tax=Aeromicrobium piscarium TaxID=2590901 RepID=UPI001FE74789|nr:HAMP domain-containing sensor histidine kinase [Aeromicrobium piscarium]
MSERSELAERPKGLVDRFLDWLHDALSPVTSRISLAARVTILTTVAVALVLSVVSAVFYVTVRSEFIGSVDQTLVKRANDAVDAGVTASSLNSTNAGSVQQMLNAMGIRVVFVNGGDLLTQKVSSVPYGIPEQEVALGTRSQSARTVDAGGEPFRIVSIQTQPGQAFVLAQSMESTQRALDRLAVVLVLASAAGVAMSAMAGWAVASNGLRPVRRLTAATERIASTGEMEPIDVWGTRNDELARLTRSFNTMLRALGESQTRERQLIADAGHELRTPLTSLRTNIELLRQATSDPDRRLDAEAQGELMDDVRAQLDELTSLIGDLVELARDEPLHRDPEPLALDDIVEQSLTRVRLRAPGVTWDVALDDSQVVGESQSLERAVTNLLDNAAKWSPPDGTITVRLTEGVLSISDEGPGIAEEDLPHVFQRFYRSTAARSLPGSGLGLSIVQRAAERHGGRVEVASILGSGSTFTLHLPLAPSGGP